MNTNLAETEGGKVDRRTIKKTPEQKKALKQGRVNEVLERWDLLPDDAFVRVGVVAALEACSIPTVWRRVHTGGLPKPLKLSRMQTAWQVGELRAFREARAAGAQS